MNSHWTYPRKSAELRRCADELDAADRFGLKIDDPEGVRTVVVSDTVLRKIARDYRAFANLLDLMNSGSSNGSDTGLDIPAGNDTK